MDDAKLNDYLNVLVNHEMERNIDALVQAYWTTGAAMISFDEAGLVVRPISYEEMHEELLPEAMLNNSGDR